MRIAIVAPEVFPVPPIRGGAVEAGIEEITSHLTDHDVHIFGVSDPDLPLYEQKGHRTYHRFEKRLRDKALLSSWKLPFKKSNSRFYYWPYVQWAAGKIRALSPDVIRVHSRIQFVPSLRRVAPQAEIILSIHNVSNLEGEKIWNEEAIFACDRLTGVSRYLVDEIVTRYPSCREKTHVLYNGVNPSIFQPIWDGAAKREMLRQEKGVFGKLVILYVGRLVEEKGVHLLIDAFKKISLKLPEARLFIVGSHTFSDSRKTPYIERLHKEAEGFEEKISFVGYVPRKEIGHYYLMSDLVAFPSLWREPFGNVVLEAMASGLPLLAFDKGGHAEVIQNGRDGLLVPYAEGVAGFTEALLRLGKDKLLREKIGREARRTVEERFTWKAVARDFLAIWEVVHV